MTRLQRIKGLWCLVFGHRRGPEKCDSIRAGALGHLSLRDGAGMRWTCQRCGFKRDDLSDQARGYFEDYPRATVYPKPGSAEATQEWRFWRCLTGLGIGAGADEAARRIRNTREDHSSLIDVGAALNGTINAIEWAPTDEADMHWGHAFVLAAAVVLGEDPRLEPWKVDV